VTTPTLSTIPLADVTPVSSRRAVTDDPRRVVWAPVVAGLWSASDAVGHVGLVEQRGHAFTAIDGRGHTLGTFAARHQAEAAVEAAVRTTV
jgi:hypothetical protein